MRLTIRECVPKGVTILAGSGPGNGLFAKMIQRVGNPREPAPIFLDFADIEVATASYLRESVLAFRAHCCARELPLYPVIANASEAILEELGDLLRQRGDAMVACTLTKQGEPREGRLLGQLEPAQLQTLKAILRLGAANAVTLAQENKGIQATAWNNRLAYLANKAILMETREGRSKVYRPVIELEGV